MHAAGPKAPCWVLHFPKEAPCESTAHHAHSEMYIHSAGTARGLVVAYKMAGRAALKTALLPPP